MAQETNIVAEPRTVHGSSAARRLRRSGFVPGVLATTAGQTELLQLNAHDFEREVARHSNPQFIAHISLGGWMKNYVITPEQFGLKRCTKQDLVGGTPAENAEIIRNAFACGEPTVVLDMAVIRSKQLNIIPERYIIKRSCELLDPDDDGMELCKCFLTSNGLPRMR